MTHGCDDVLSAAGSTTHVVGAGSVSTPVVAPDSWCRTSISVGLQKSPGAAATSVCCPARDSCSRQTPRGVHRNISPPAAAMYALAWTCIEESGM